MTFATISSFLSSGLVFLSRLVASAVSSSTSVPIHSLMSIVEDYASVSFSLISHVLPSQLQLQDVRRDGPGLAFVHKRLCHKFGKGDI